MGRYVRGEEISPAEGLYALIFIEPVTLLMTIVGLVLAIRSPHKADRWAFVPILVLCAYLTLLAVMIVGIASRM